MHDKDYLLSLLNYNAWGNDLYYGMLNALPDDEVAKQRPSLMNSMLISMNHILVIEKVWLAHMRGEKHGFEKLQTVLHEDLAALLEDKKLTDAELRAYVVGLSEDDLEEVVEYELISGNRGSLPRYLMITHLAMHGAFHRGFVADMMGQVPAPAMPQDIPVWEQALRG